MLAALVLAAALAGCSAGAPPQNAAAQGAPYFRPAAPGQTPTALPAAGREIENQAAQPGEGTCHDSLSFLQDVTIPDGTSVTALSTLDKRWEVENSGTCGWDERYRLRLIAGPEMGAQKEQALFPARSGARVVLRIIFVAPDEPGTYRSAWQAFRPQGDPFGDPIFIDITVAE
jgi:hypothetical protein